MSQHQGAYDMYVGGGAGTVGIVAAIICVALPQLPTPVPAPALDGRVVLRRWKRERSVQSVPVAYVWGIGTQDAQGGMV